LAEESPRIRPRSAFARRSVESVDATEGVAAMAVAGRAAATSLDAARSVFEQAESVSAARYTARNGKMLTIMIRKVEGARDVKLERNAVRRECKWNFRTL